MSSVMDISDGNSVMCRACMMHINPITCKPLFSDHLGEMFTKCTDIKVDISDRLPAQICLTCFQTLNLAHSFKEQCISSDFKLKELIKTNDQSLNDIKFDIKDDTNVHEIKLEDEYYSRDDNESTSTVFEFELTKHMLDGTVACKSEPEPVEEVGDEMQQVCNSKTNTVTNITKDIKSRVKQRIKNEDDENYSPESSEESDEENVQKKNKQKSKQKGKLKSKHHLCKLCGRSYSKEYLKRHLQSHKCDICNKLFILTSDLREHRKNHKKNRSYICDLCGKVLIGQRQHYRHKRTHEIRKPLSCKECDKVFKTAGTLRDHIGRVHMGQKKRVCHLCGKSFFNQFGLRRHIRTHTKERPFECTHCKKRFPTSTHLKSHIMVHTGVRPFACDLCPKAFRDKKVLNNHRMRHTGEKPHVCLVCQRAFIQRTAMITHMKIHTGTPPGDNTDKNAPNI